MGKTMEPMNGLSQALSGIIHAAAQASPPEDTDYEVFGIRYCGRCRTAKEKRITICNQEMVVPMLCKCRADAYHEQERIRAEEKRREQIAARRDKAFGLHGTPRRDPRTWTFENDNGKHERIMLAAKGYVDNWELLEQEGQGLLFHSTTTGTGKSYAAAAIVNALVDQGIPCLFTSMTRIYSEAGSVWSQQSQYYDSLNDYKLLVIDDLGAERQTETMLEAVYRVINERYNTRLPLIVTTNFDKDTLMKGTGPYARVLSRLYEMCVPIEAVGGDERVDIMFRQNKNFQKLLGL